MSAKDEQSGVSVRSHKNAPAEPATVDTARLWAAFRERDDVAALQQLYETLRPEILRYCRSVLGDAHLAEDATHTAFVRLLVRRPSVTSDFKRLLLVTARNICRDELRKRRRRSSLLRLVRPARTQHEQADPADEDEAVSALQDCLSQLDEHDRSLVVLTVAMGYSHRAAADILGWSAADHTITRCLKSIKNKLLRCLQKKQIFDANSG